VIASGAAATTGSASRCSCATCAIPAFALPTDAEPPASLLNIVGRQLRIEPDIWPQYAQRPETRREHLLELQAWLKLTPFTVADYRHFVLPAR
jgi:hypothetical protein